MLIIRPSGSSSDHMQITGGTRALAAGEPLLDELEDVGFVGGSRVVH